MRQKLRTAFVLFGVAFLMSGTKACQKDYCIACDANVGTTATATPTQTETATQTSTPTGSVSPAGTLTPTRTPTGTRTVIATPTGTPPTPTVTQTPTGTIVPPPLRSLKKDGGTVPDKSLRKYSPAAGAGPNWLGNLASPAFQDSDGDGFVDDLESTSGTNPKDPKSYPTKFKTNFQEDLKQSGEIDNVESLLHDSDGDGCPDGAEILSGSDPHDASSNVSPDTDGDCLSDDYEKSVGLNPNAPDTDHDGVRDDVEVLSGMNPWSPDTDGDGILDWQELRIGTDPRKTDF